MTWQKRNVLAMNDRRWRKKTPDASRVDREILMPALSAENALSKLSEYFGRSAPIPSP